VVRETHFKPANSRGLREQDRGPPLNPKEAPTPGMRPRPRNAGTGSRCDREKLDRSAGALAQRFGSHGTLGRGTRPFSASDPGLPPRRPAFADFGPETGPASAGLINAFRPSPERRRVICARGREAPPPRPILGQRAVAFLLRQKLEKQRSDNMLVLPLLSCTDRLFGVQDSPIHTYFLKVIRKPQHG